jgi:hypothetical protein
LPSVDEKEDENEDVRGIANIDIGNIFSNVPSTSPQTYGNILNLQPPHAQNKQISMKRYKAHLYNSLSTNEYNHLSELKHDSDISIQTTFVALLHLANEKGLAFESTNLNDDFTIDLRNKKMENE